MTQSSNVVYWQIVRRCFYQMASFKIDFYFEFFKHWNLLKLTAIFIALLMIKTYLAVSSSYQWVDVFVNLLADRKPVGSTPKYSLLA